MWVTTHIFEQLSCIQTLCGGYTFTRCQHHTFTSFLSDFCSSENMFAISCILCLQVALSTACICFLCLIYRLFCLYFQFAPKEAEMDAGCLAIPDLFAHLSSLLIIHFLLPLTKSRRDKTCPGLHIWLMFTAWKCPSYLNLIFIVMKAQRRKQGVKNP